MNDVHGLGAGLVDGDPADERLVNLVHPAGWTNPTPPAGGRYDVLAIGGGTAGLVTAMGAAGLGGRAALIERHLLGGDCLNFGCVPSKALLAAAHAAHAARGGAAWGVHRGGAVEVDFPAIMARLRGIRADIAVHDSAERLAGAGVDVYLGEARFVGPDAVLVGGQTLRFKRCVIATGARAALPPIPGLADVRVLTNETVFALTELPARLAVIGGGPIGCELAQAFARLGSAVTLIEMAPGVLGKDDPEAAALVAESLGRDGVRLRLGASIARCERGADGASVVVLGTDGAEERVTVDAVLVAAGRRPNTEGLGLEAAGVAYDRRGITVDDRLRTANTRIYAAGDCASAFQFTHAADATARIVLQNALFFGRKRLSALTIPWVTYTDPEVAHVGLGMEAIAARGAELTAITVPMARNDRAICEGATEGFLRVHVDRKGRIAAATIVGAHAGELLSELTVAMTQGVKLASLAAVIHPYPTRSEVIKRAADEHNRGRLTPFVARLLAKIIAWRR